MPSKGKSTRLFLEKSVRSIVLDFARTIITLARTIITFRPKDINRRLILAILSLVMVMLAIRIIWVGSQWVRETSDQDRLSGQEYYQKAIELSQAGDWLTARDYLEQALKKYNNLDWRSQLAVIYYNLGNYDQAIAEYQKLISADKNLAFAYNGLGNCYRDQQDFVKAEENYLAAIKTDSNYLVAYTNLAIMLVDQGQKEKARGLLDGAIEQTGSRDLEELRRKLS